MISRGRIFFVCLSLLTVAFLIAGSLGAAGSQGEDDGSDSLYKYLSVFTEVLSLVQRAYVDETEVETLLTGAFEGAADALDPLSVYVPAAHVEAYVAARRVGTRRSGLLVLKDRGVAFAAAVEEGSPAADAGLQRGDILSQIDGLSTREMPLWQIHTVLAGPAGTAIEIERLRLGQQETVTLELADFDPTGVVLETRRGVAVLRPSGFYAETPDDFAATLRTLEGGDGELPGLEKNDRLVIDLRGVAGGEEAAAYGVAEFFTAGELGALKAKEKTLETFTAAGEPLFQGRLVVLIDQGTQGAAEVLAAVLRQSAGARLVGSSSFGHSGRQSLLELSNGARLQLTDAFFTGPDREPLDESLEPDFEVRQRLFATPEEAEEGRDDPVLERGIEVVLETEEAPAEKAA